MKIGHVNNWRPEVGSLLCSLKKACFTITGANNGEDEYTGADYRKLVDCLTACDEGYIYATAPDGKKVWLNLVLGNSPGELVSDYSCHDGLDAVTDAHGEKWEGRAQPTKPCKFALERHEFNLAARKAQLVNIAAAVATLGL